MGWESEREDEKVREGKGGVARGYGMMDAWAGVVDGGLTTFYH